MAFENSAGLGVNNHYGQRNVGGTQGVYKTEGAKSEAVINYDGDALGFKVVIPAGAVVTEIVKGFATGAVTAATVGVVNIAGATGVVANYVAVPLGGDLTVTGPTAGRIIVLYQNVA